MNSQSLLAYDAMILDFLGNTVVYSIFSFSKQIVFLLSLFFALVNISNRELYRRMIYMGISNLLTFVVIASWIFMMNPELDHPNPQEIQFLHGTPS